MKALRALVAGSARRLVVAVSVLAAPTIGWGEEPAFVGATNLVAAPMETVADHAQRVRAQALLQVEREPTFRVNHDLIDENRVPFEAFVADQIAWLTSDVVLDRVLSTPEVMAIPLLAMAAHPREALRAAIHAEPVNGSEIVAVTVTIDVSPDAAANLVNHVIDAYLKLQTDLRMHRIGHVVESLDQELDRRRNEMKQLRHAMRILDKSATGGELSAETMELAQRAAFQVVQELQSELRQTHRERARLQMLVAFADADLAAAEKNFENQKAFWAAERVEQDELIGRLRGDLERRADELREQTKTHDQADPLLAELSEELERLRNRLASREQQLLVRALALLREEHLGPREQKHQELRRELECRSALEERLTVELAEAQMHLARTTELTADWARVRGELVRLEEVHRRLADQADTLRLEMLAPSRVRELRRARAEDVVQLAGEPGR